MLGVREEPLDIERQRIVRRIEGANWAGPRAPRGAHLWRHVWCGLIVACIGCHAAAPPPPPEPPLPPPPAVVEAPPPPKCEKVEEACVAGAETRARIGQVGWHFAPPASWIYAQGEELTVA